MGEALTYKKIILKEVESLSENKLKEVVDYLEFLALKDYMGFDKLLKRTREAAEKKGHKLSTVGKLIKSVRRK